MLVSDFDFDLPDELIAQEPLATREGSRMLHLQRESGQCADRWFRDFPDLLQSGDLVVFNNTRVFPARLYGRREGVKAQTVSQKNPAAREFLRGRVEVLLTRQLSNEPYDWECLVRPGRKIGVGERLFFGEGDELRAEVLARAEFGERHIRFDPVEDFFGRLERIGHVPLPPYIGRADSSRDRERYQTVYARERGSVAAPTAGLHFTEEIIQGIRERGAEVAEITLHVGLGTFKPVRVERVEDHKIHSEAYSISDHAAGLINRALLNSRRVVAIGTTTVRTLEHAIRIGDGKIVAGEGVADIFIYPDFEKADFEKAGGEKAGFEKAGCGFRVVKAMLTNFHLPQSTLLMLVSAFGGKENVLRAYEHAVAERYRFYSYGDCMFVE